MALANHHSRYSALYTSPSTTTSLYFIPSTTIFENDVSLGIVGFGLELSMNSVSIFPSAFLDSATSSIDGAVAGLLLAPFLAFFCSPENIFANRVIVFAS